MAPVTAERKLALLREVAERGLVDGYSTLDLVLLLRFLAVPVPGDEVSRQVSPAVDVACSARVNVAGVPPSGVGLVGPLDGGTLSVAAVAELLSVSPQRVRAQVRTGRFGPVARGPRQAWQIPREAVLAAVKATERDRRRRER